MDGSVPTHTKSIFSDMSKDGYTTRIPTECSTNQIQRQCSFTKCMTTWVIAKVMITSPLRHHLDSATIVIRMMVGNTTMYSMKYWNGTEILVVRPFLAVPITGVRTELAKIGIRIFLVEVRWEDHHRAPHMGHRAVVPGQSWRN